MNFFKKLFSSHKDTIANDKETESQSDHQDQVVTDKTSNNKNEVSMIYTEEYFAQRYVEENIHDNPKLLDGSLKMIESYFPHLNLADLKLFFDKMKLGHYG